MTYSDKAMVTWLRLEPGASISHMLKSVFLMTHMIGHDKLYVCQYLIKGC